VLAVSAAVVALPLVLRLAPDDALPWIGARPPLFTHPDCGVENAFAVGAPPETTARLAARRALRFEVRPRNADVYRVAQRRGTVRSIQKQANALDALDLSSSATPPREQALDGAPCRTLPRALLRVGEPVPPDVFAPGQQVLFISIAQPGADANVHVVMDRGRVRSIRSAAPGAAAETGRPLAAITLRGEDIAAVVDADRGRPLRVRHLFGTDELGRDLLTRVCYGGRISLLIGLVSTAVSVLIGVAYGAVAGYRGGAVDRTMMGAVDVLYALPFLFLVIVFMVMFGRSIVMLFIALGAVQWLTMARIVRGQVFSLKGMAFVDAARLGGSRPAGVLFRHILPHTLGPVAVYTTLTVPVVIMEESFLSFLGLQVQFHGLSLDSWGSLISRGIQSLGAHGEKAWLLLFPAAVMVLTLAGLNCLGDGLRDSLDPREGGGR
jgi:oligopeptide transport system permease protein